MFIIGAFALIEGHPSSLGIDLPRCFTFSCSDILLVVPCQEPPTTNPGFRRRNNSKPGLLLQGVILLVAAVSPLVLPAQTARKQKPSVEKTIPLIGRVLAWKLPLFLGAGVGPLYEVLVFGVEGSAAEGIRPTKIMYTFFESNASLPDNFFDYSKRYELQVSREPKCDETVEEFSYVKSVEHGSGKPLPPTYVLRFLEGAPKDVLKPDAVLACYILRPGKYRVLAQNKDRAAPTTR